MGEPWAAMKHFTAGLIFFIELSEKGSPGSTCEDARERWCIDRDEASDRPPQLPLVGDGEGLWPAPRAIIVFKMLQAIIAFAFCNYG